MSTPRLSLLPNPHPKYKTISSYPGAHTYYDYDVANTSVMSVVYAGNATLSIKTNVCPMEGCDGPLFNPF